MAALALSGATTAQAAAADDLGPAPGLCNLGAPQPCFFVVGYVGFSLSGHVLHIGDKLTGKMSWTLPGKGSGSVEGFASSTLAPGGVGLKFEGCSGPTHVVNDQKDVHSQKKGSSTCHWKAVSDSGGWQTSLGNSLSITGSNSYTAGDFYAVVGKGQYIDGHVQEKNARKTADALTGVAGAKVRITGPGGFKGTYAVDGVGYYFAKVGKPGTYTVRPVLPKRYKDTHAKPESRDVHVSRDDTSSADFEVPSSLVLKLKFDKTSVPANGFGLVTATVTATEQGKPVSGLNVKIRPKDWTVVDAEKLPVPAAVCIGISRIWPSGARFPAASLIPPTQTTDSAGQLKMTIALGTIPGRFTLQTLAEDSAGSTIIADDTRPSETINVTDTGNPDLSKFTTWFSEGATWQSKFATAVPGLGGFPSTDGPTLSGQLAQMTQAYNAASTRVAGSIRETGLVFDPVTAPGSSGVLVRAAKDRPAVGPNGEFPTTAAGLMILPNNVGQAARIASGFSWTNLVQSGQIPALLNVAQWIAGGVGSGWQLTPAAGNPSIVLNVFNFFGYGYPQPGGCA